MLKVTCGQIRKTWMLTVGILIPANQCSFWLAIKDL